MKLTDAEAIKALKKANIYDLEMMLSDYPESDRDGRSDWDMIANEAGWLLDSFNDTETANHEALVEAESVVRLSRYGWEYKEYEIRGARDLINMVRRLKRFVAKLKDRGLYCPYC